MRLYSYYRSSAAYRVRIALNLKQIEHSIEPVNLLKKEHKSPNYLAKQPQGLVPCLETDKGQLLAQSGAILSYLDSLYPHAKLLPADPFQAAKIQSVVDMIACDIHPVCNLRILNYLTDILTVDSEQKLAWYRHWIVIGFEALETLLNKTQYCFGEQPTLADVYLIPQVFNALRFEVDMASFPKIMNAYQNCNQLDAFIDAKPENQVDAMQPALKT
ncbi:maleylacetoacetate isomerase [uncultured Paraglaciecola sp.]|uniref:maleylacetoacetate isomerase n=1 Tax=uncultured Paraglaciecola sp. TaxID=1765024 RepID=UPI0025E73641|nr:maleylacetoacetate isomerase [uncultured Paraglaciecola sp.]